MAEAIAWIDTAAARLPAQMLPLDQAAGRVLAAGCRAGEAMPERDRALLDGFAVAAQASLGAGTYNPLAVPAAAIAAGDPLPAGTDAVVPLGSAEPDGADGVLLVEPLAPGANVQRRGSVAAVGAVLVAAGTRLAPPHLGLLAGAGLTEIAVVRRPRIVILLVEPRPPRRVRDINRPMLNAAAERDGGITVAEAIVEPTRTALAAALAASRGDIVLVLGGTGRGPDDHAAEALAEAGELALHGIAVRPGETIGLGRLGGGVPAVLLPRAPPACLWSYELFAGRAIRRLGGRDPELPFRRCKMIAGRKIISAIGMTEICALRFGKAAGTVEPLPSSAEIGLMAAAAADGFTVIPEANEGYPAGAAVSVYCYDQRPGGEPIEP